LMARSPQKPLTEIEVVSETTSECARGNGVGVR